jgi:hypothetical protein
MDENNKELKKQLKVSETKPLVSSPTERTSESTDISKIIKPLEKIVDTGKPIKDNKLVTSDDKVTVSELSDILSKPLRSRQTKPNVISKDGLSESDSKRLIQEENKRRTIESNRRDDIEKAYKDELERRNLFKQKIQLMKDKFQLYAKQNYPNIVGERYISNDGIDEFKNSINTRKVSLKNSESELYKNKVDRLERERLRKLSESELQINKVTTDEVQTFFENEIILEQKVKIKTNPEIENLNEVKQLQRDINDIEISMGRDIIYHRDVVESSESDFDINSLTNSEDTLVLTDRNKLTPEEINKRESLEQLRLRLRGDDTEELYILKN